VTLRQFRLPDLGEGLTESDIIEWRVAEGESVELNQIIAEVETAKALVEIPSPYAGVVAELHAREGETVNVGDPLVTFAVAGEAPAPAPAPAPASAAPAPTAAAAAPAPAADEPQASIIGHAVQPERTGRPRRRPRKVPEGVRPAAPIVVRPGAERPRSTPPVRHLARQLGIDLDRVTGTGPGGLITREDVAAIANRIDDAGPVTRVPIRGVRKHTAAAMVASAFTAPHVSVFHTIDVTPSIELAARLTAEHGTKVNLLAVVARVVCLALVRHPELNSRWEDATQELVQYGYVNLGIAAATDRGLVVPNVKGADGLGVVELARALAELTAEARGGKAGPERLSGGTFTITNIGVFGVEAGTPILNPGEAGILALGAAQRRPWEFEGGIALRQVLTLSLSFDHRVVDGEQGSRFLAEVGGMLSAPDEALLVGS